MELGIPVVMAINMMDVVRKNKDVIKIDVDVYKRQVFPLIPAPFTAWKKGCGKLVPWKQELPSVGVNRS